MLQPVGRVTVGIAVRWLRLSAAAVHDRPDWLSELDAAIGDGDHGINLDRGFERIIVELDAHRIATDDPGRMLETAGRLILGTVGGASGALYGRAFMRAGDGLAVPAGPGQGTLDRFVVAIADGVDSIGALGRSVPGEKTMLDALAPAVRVLRIAAADGTPFLAAVRSAVAAAEAGAQSTIPLIATKGRASYLGERSIGHLDPGAASSALMLAALVEAAEQEAAEPVEGTRGHDSLHGRG